MLKQQKSGRVPLVSNQLIRYSAELDIYKKEQK